MKLKTSVPPQAYTRETLTRAYEWLKTQPQALRDKASSADALVSLYLHSKRFGSPTLALLDENQPKLEDLISVENFKQDLKQLAQGLRQFEDVTPVENPTPVESSASRPVVPEPRPSTQSSVPPQTSTFETMESGGFMHQPPPPTASQTMGYSTTSTPPHPQPTSPKITAEFWDEKTRYAVSRTREKFNLGSEQEALRMLVAIGFDSLRDHFSRGF